MSDPSFSTIHLAMRCAEHVLSVGSGVLYESDERLFVVTAWHNFSGRHSETFHPLSPTAAVPDNVILTVPVMVDESRDVLRLCITVPLHDDEAATYLIHPDPWPRKDVAVLPIDAEASYPSEYVLSDETTGRFETRLRQQGNVGNMSFEPQPIQRWAGSFRHFDTSATNLLHPGDDLFVLGYPRGISDFTRAPIWKRATVASDPHGGWNRQPCFLIDCASRQGMSGAPVITYSRSGTVKSGGTTYIGNGPSSMLCGIYVGRLPHPDTQPKDILFEAQLGTVWKTSVIDEIIGSAQCGPHPDHIEASATQIEAALLAAWPRERGNDPHHLRLPVVRFNVAHHAIAALGANVKPDDVHNQYDRLVAALEAAGPAPLSDGRRVEASETE